MPLAYIVLAAAAVAGLALATLLVAALVGEDFAFWPPPAEGSWQDYAFWGLFRAYCAGIVVCGLLDPVGFAWIHPSRLAVGAPLLAVGAVATLYGYGFLGLDNTYGRRAGLVTDGIYAYSRNPQYVASILASAAWTLTMNSPLALALTLGLIGLYTLFARNEERWLIEQYGEPYLRYLETAPRFIGWTTLRRVLERDGGEGELRTSPRDD